MKQNTKDWIHYGSAIVLIASAIVMAFFAFFLTLDVGPGPLAYIAEALSAALAIYGIGVYAIKKIGEIKDEVLSEVRKETT